MIIVIIINGQQIENPQLCSQMTQMVKKWETYKHYMPNFLPSHLHTFLAPYPLDFSINTRNYTREE